MQQTPKFNNVFDHLKQSIFTSGDSFGSFSDDSNVDSFVDSEEEENTQLALA